MPIAFRDTHPLPVDKLLDTRLSKHYLPVTTVADGNKLCVFPRLKLFVNTSCKTPWNLKKTTKYGNMILLPYLVKNLIIIFNQD